MAFSNNGKEPRRIEKFEEIKVDDFIELLKRRRSIKHFKDMKIPKEILRSLAGVSQYAPTMNKNIEIIIIDDEKLIKRIDEAAMEMIRKMYAYLFGNKLLFRFSQLFSETLPIIKRKIERDLFGRKKVIKDNTQALILMIGSTKIPVTECSAQYYLSNMIIYCELIGLGSCLMDSLKIAINRSKSIKDSLNIPRGYKILGVLAIGYPGERILNIPEGYNVKIGWNSRWMSQGDGSLTHFGR